MEMREKSQDVLARSDKNPRRKRLKVSKNSKETLFDSGSRPATQHCQGINRLPIEVLLDICSYLDPRDLYNLREVCKLFSHVVGSPAVWRTFEVTGNEVNTLRVIQELRRMPLLKKFTLNARADSDDILRQLSVTNKNLEELYILNCTGSTAKLYLRSLHLIRILEKCNRLHTINILGTRFRGVKFYRLLADMGLRLRAASTPATPLQFRTFANHAVHIPEAGRQILNDMYFGCKNWAPLHYYVIDRNSATPSAFISYLNRDFISVDM
ncbi:uncharacterized protein [Neodiprion pinetum]|uniref:Uncharacterized protein LOC107224244 n=1 Tax=Neodiprion lecontei TaxID=441921 RepID=A0A6J0BXP2_NEOLC|nr:uncharacterized protein LOC107224244 [Neodiprion lecontei]XP_046420560.1 uncharacterized protein LOC124179828 [Neodiprion fabricii]XP_046476992.1 uncharacterized protein LOC124216478 [Neodiprion pinetum]